MNMQDIRLFFWMCTGTPIGIIEKYPTEHNKFIGIGATIFFTALFAGLSGGYALYYVFAGSPFAVFFAIVFGILWGLAIFNLDRYIVSSVNKTAKGLRQFYQASPRLIFAILIAIVIARPLELKIFEKEIKEVLKSRYLREQQERITRVQDSFSDKYALELEQIEKLQKEYDEVTNEVSLLREELKSEVFGQMTGKTSGVVGFGTYAKQKQEVIQARQQREDYLASRLTELETFINRQKEAEGINDQMMLSESRLAARVSTAGFADRNWALGQLTEGGDDVNNSSANAVLFITLLFIAFECAPILVKLLSDVGPSDVDIHESEARIIRWLTATSPISKNRFVRAYRNIGGKPGRRLTRKPMYNKRVRRTEGKGKRI
ncbi:MAG: DUF4407 domain-containing protein [Chlorobium phaeobacteroides]|uniref:DUF4407 domain-containing protein n=1 Tax=Chlorobium phaeobacteroides (strain BS1) TaxID=331678 RepID=B3EMU2_CHLPB|nr:DUF4407 domain-containing protein [Chlorobium phaeobacteroides]